MIRGLVALLVVVVVGLGLVAAAAGGGSRPPAYHPASAYHWAQPGTAHVTSLHSQPPAWIPIV